MKKKILSVCTYLIAGAFHSSAQDIPIAPMPAEFISPRPVAELALVMGTKSGKPMHYEDILYIWTDDETPPVGDRRAKETRIPSSSRLRLAGSHPALWSVKGSAEEDLREILGEYNRSVESTGNFSILGAGKGVALVANSMRKPGGKLLKIEPALDQPIHLSGSEATPTQRLQSFVDALSVETRIKLEAAPPMKFDWVFGGNENKRNWPEERGTAREVLLRFIEASSVPLIYHLYCQPDPEAKNGLCVLNLTRQLVEVENEAGNRVLRFLQ